MTALKQFYLNLTLLQIYLEDANLPIILGIYVPNFINGKFKKDIIISQNNLTAAQKIVRSILYFLTSFARDVVRVE